MLKSFDAVDVAGTRDAMSNGAGEVPKAFKVKIAGSPGSKALSVVVGGVQYFTRAGFTPPSFAKAFCIPPEKQLSSTIVRLLGGAPCVTADKSSLVRKSASWGTKASIHDVPC